MKPFLQGVCNSMNKFPSKELETVTFTPLLPSLNRIEGEAPLETFETKLRMYLEFQKKHLTTNFNHNLNRAVAAMVLTR